MNGLEGRLISCDTLSDGRAERRSRRGERVVLAPRAGQLRALSLR